MTQDRRAFLAFAKGSEGPLQRVKTAMTDHRAGRPYHASDDLHAAMCFSVIQQDAVAVVIAAASSAHQFVDPSSLGRVYSPFHNIHLRLGIKITPTDFR